VPHSSQEHAVSPGTDQSVRMFVTENTTVPKTSTNISKRLKRHIGMVVGISLPEIGTRHTHIR
jgi:hypothetical protein